LYFSGDVQREAELKAPPVSSTLRGFRAPASRPVFGR
jgi:hypothetical protein